MKLLKRRRHLNRRRLLLRDGVLLLLSLVLLFAALDFPIPTAELARRATERRSFFGPSQVLGVVENDGRTAYAVRWRNWYGQVTVSRDGFFWSTGQVTSVENDADLPLVPLIPSGQFAGLPHENWIFSNDPNIVRVTLEYLLAMENAPAELYLSSQDEPVGSCFILDVSFPIMGFYNLSRHFRLSGYDAAGNLVWRSPTPQAWADEFGYRE